MHKANVQIICAKLSPVAVEIRARRLRITRPRLSQHHNLVARNVLQCFGHMRMAPIRIRRIEEAQAIVISIQKQSGKPFQAELRLVRTTSETDRSRPHRKTARLDPGFPKNNRVRRIELLWQGRKRPDSFRQRSSAEPRGAQA